MVSVVIWSGDGFSRKRVTAPSADAWSRYDRWNGQTIRWGAPLETIGDIDVYALVAAKLAEITKVKAEIAVEINELKKQRNAVILGHNYMEPALYHSIPDYVGDSLELSRVAAKTDAEVELAAKKARIVCGH